MNAFPVAKKIKVGLDFGKGTIPVGRLAIRERRIYFAYESTFIEQGLEISPFILPLKAGVTNFDNSLFEGLPGVFNDSLPDGWGKLLFDRLVQSQGILPLQLSPLDRLSSVGAYGMGALVYEPATPNEAEDRAISLDTIAQQAQEVLKGTSQEVVQKLLA